MDMIRINKSIKQLRDGVYMVYIKRYKYKFITYLVVNGDEFKYIVQFLRMSSFKLEHRSSYGEVFSRSEMSDELYPIYKLTDEEEAVLYIEYI